MKNRYRYLKNCLYPQVFTRHSYIVQCEWTLLIFQPPLIDNEWLSQHTHGKIGFVSKLYCKQKWKHPSDSDSKWHAYIFIDSRCLQKFQCGVSCLFYLLKRPSSQYISLWKSTRLYSWEWESPESKENNCNLSLTNHSH